MASKKDPYDANHAQVFLPCPACGQKYIFLNLMVQAKQDMACSVCNAIFHLRLDGSKPETVLVNSTPGAPLGPAEGPHRH